MGLEDAAKTQLTISGKDYVLPMEENRIIESVTVDALMDSDVTVDETCLLTEDAIGAEPEEDDEDGDDCRDETQLERKRQNEREEYDSLIKNRFKDFYAEDTQRLINRRFRKYKVMEERFKLLEETLAQKEAQNDENQKKIAEFESVLRLEVEKAVKETEERVINEIRTKRIRPAENGASPRLCEIPFDVSGLTRKERANLAKRAAGGEKIKF